MNFEIYHNRTTLPRLAQGGAGGKDRGATLASTTMRRPLRSTISIRPMSIAPDGGTCDPSVTSTGANAPSNNPEPGRSAIFASRAALRQAKTWLGCSP